MVKVPRDEFTSDTVSADLFLSYYLLLLLLSNLFKDTLAPHNNMLVYRRGVCKEK